MRLWAALAHQSEARCSEPKMFADVSPGWGIASSVIAAVSGLGGVGIGAWMTGRNQARERRSARLQEQLQHFYSPMLGMRAQILSKSEISLKIRSATVAAARDNFKWVTDPEVQRQIDEEEIPEFRKLQEYNDTQLRAELVPLYRKMLDHFSSHMWLAEKSTQRHYHLLCEFVEFWNRSLASVPTGGIAEDEEKLYPLYNDLQDHFDRLVEALRK
jgi:hypothetical protein